MYKEEDEPLRSLLSKMRLNSKMGTSSIRDIASLNLEVEQINQNYVERKTQYAYMVIIEPWPNVFGIAKMDLLEKGIP